MFAHDHPRPTTAPVLEIMCVCGHNSTLTGNSAGIQVAAAWGILNVLEMFLIIQKVGLTIHSRFKIITEGCLAQPTRVHRPPMWG